MSDEDESPGFSETTSEGRDSESNLSDKSSTNDSTSGLSNNKSTTGSTTNNSTTGSTTKNSTTGSSTNNSTTGSATNKTPTGSTTNESSTGSDYKSTDASSKSSRAGDISEDRESVDLEWNEQNFLLPGDIFNLDSRKIRAEDPHWALSPVPELATIIIRAVKCIQGPGLANLKANAEPEQWRQILEILPLTIPFNYTLSVIEDGIYWMRHCYERWSASEIWKFGDSWKTMLIEREVFEEIENFNPENSDIKELEDFLKIFKDYVFRLQIHKLVRIEKKRFVVDLSLNDFDDLLDEFINEPEVHISFLSLENVLSSLMNLKEFSFVLMPSCLDPETHQLSVKDFNSLLRGLRRLQKLEKFRCSNGVVPNAQINILNRHFIPHECLKQLNMSYNFIDDDCCDSLGQLLISSCPLEVLILKYNKVSDQGAIAIASALSVNDKLRKLDLSLNWIGNKGGTFLAKVISTNQYLEEFDISYNKLGCQAGLSFAEVIKVSKHFRSFNLSGNHIGKDAGKELAKAMEGNSTILDFGIKFCYLSPQNEDVIYRAVVRNRIPAYQKDGDDFIKLSKF